MIPLKTIIRDASWLKCRIRERSTFQIRILRFEKLDYSQVDNPEEAEPIEDGAVRWLMELEVVNISKVHVKSYELTGELRVADRDGYMFERDNDGHLCCHSEYAKRSGLYKLYCQSLMPKVKIKGAILFRVPDEDTEYSLAIDDGTLEEA